MSFRHKTPTSQAVCHSMGCSRDLSALCHGLVKALSDVDTMVLLARIIGSEKTTGCTE